MKNIAIVVLVVLLAIAGYVILKDRSPDGEGPPPGNGGGVSVKPLPPEVEKALGAERSAIVAMIGYDGSVQLFTPSETYYKEAQLPLDAKIQNIAPFSIITYEGSQCVLWIPARMVNGQWVPAFCAKWVP